MTKSEENFKNNKKKEKSINTFYKTIDVHCTHNVSLYSLAFFFQTYIVQIKQYN